MVPFSRGVRMTSGDLTRPDLPAVRAPVPRLRPGVLSNGPNPIPVITPAVNYTGDPAQLTENNGPFIDLLIKSQQNG